MNLTILQGLQNRITIEPLANITTESSIAGKIIVFTGTLNTMTRQEAKNLREKAFLNEIANNINGDCNNLKFGYMSASKFSQAS